MKKLWSLVVLSLALALSLSPRAARADEEAVKLASHGKAIRYTVKTISPPSSVDTGGAAILVNAPIETVRKIVTSYDSYQKFLSPFDQSRVLARHKGVSEVYLQVPILSGAFHIWAVAEMPPPAKDGSGEVIAARYKRGNVADFRAVWRLRAVDADHTVLKLELLVRPKLPLPSSMITAQLVSAAEKGVTAVRNRAHAAAPVLPAKASTASPIEVGLAPAAPAPRSQDAARDDLSRALPARDEDGAPWSASPAPDAGQSDVARRQRDLARY